MTAITLARPKKRLLPRELGQLYVPGLTASGRVPLSLLDDRLEVRIPKSPEFYDSLRLTLYVDGHEDAHAHGTPYYVTQADIDDPGVTYLSLYIDKAGFPPPGTTQAWTLDYQAFDELSESGEFSMLWVTIIFDRQAPGGTHPNALEFTQEQLAGITEADLLNDQLPVTLSPWFDGSSGDYAELWLGTSANLSDGSYIKLETAISDPTAVVTVNFPRAAIEALGDGTRYFAHRLHDEIGNVSVRSDPVAIDVLLTGLPSGLLAPELVTATAGLLTYNDIVPLGPVIRIAPYEKATSGDDLWINWGTTVIDKPYRLRTDDIGQDPLAQFYVDYTQVLEAGNASALQVTYQVRRGSLLLATSPALSIDVELDVPGDVDPVPETPENENLRPLTVHADSGAVDVIDDNDYGKPARATIPRDSTEGSGPVWKIGDKVRVQWGPDPGNSSNETGIDANNESQDLVIDLPAQLHTTAGVGEFAVSYIITRPLTTPPNSSCAVSPARTVRVISRAQLPGGGSLAMAVFPEEDTTGNKIDHETGKDGTRIEVPLDGVSNVAVNDLINLRFVGVASLTNPDAGEIPGTEVRVVDHRITEQELNTERKFVVQLTPTQLKAICRNGATTGYSISNRNGTTNAERKFIRIAVNLGGGSCDW